MPEMLHSAPNVRRTTYTEVFALRPFRAVFTASVLGIVGTSLQILALSVLVYVSSGSALLSALAYGAGFFPQVIGGALFTSVADRMSPRPLLVAGCLLRCVVALVLGLMPLPSGAMIGLVAATACLQPLFSAAQGTLLPRLLTEDRYVLGRSVLNLASGGAQLAGLGVGGVLIAALGGRHAMLAAAAAQLLAGLVTAAGLRGYRHASAGVPVTRWRPGETWRGNRALLADPAIRGLLLLWWLPPALLTGAEALVVPYVAEAGGRPGNAGWLLATMPAGMILGDLVVGRFCSPATRERLVLPLMLLMGLPLLVLATQPQPAVAAGLLGAASAGFAYQLGRQQAFLGAVPEGAQGLAFGLLTTGVMTGQGMGATAAGLLAGPLGAARTMAMAGVAILACTTLLRRSDHHTRVEIVGHK